MRAPVVVSLMQPFSISTAPRALIFAAFSSMEGSATFRKSPICGHDSGSPFHRPVARSTASSTASFLNAL